MTLTLVFLFKKEDELACLIAPSSALCNPSVHGHSTDFKKCFFQGGGEPGGDDTWKQTQTLTFADAFGQILLKQKSLSQNVIINKVLKNEVNKKN